MKQDGPNGKLILLVLLSLPFLFIIGGIFKFFEWLDDDF
jgi:hypothetical protein